MNNKGRNVRVVFNLIKGVYAAVILITESVFIKHIRKVNVLCSVIFCRVHLCMTIEFIFCQLGARCVKLCTWKGIFCAVRREQRKNQLTNPTTHLLVTTSNKMIL